MEIKYKNPIQNADGGIDCLISAMGVWHPHTMVEGFGYTLDESSEWSEPLPISTEAASIKKRNKVIADIANLEYKQTPRKLREAALGDAEAIKFLQDLENEIAELRKQL